MLENIREMFKQCGFHDSVHGGHQVVATPVVEHIQVRGLPAKNVFASELHNLLGQFTGRDLPESLSVERIEEALEAVVGLRVLQVRGKAVKVDPSLYYKSLTYPAFMWPVVRSIGDIIDHEDGVELRVELGGEMVRFNKPDYQWDLIAETLRALYSFGIQLGLEMAEALPKQRDGYLPVMSFLVEDGRLVSHTPAKSHAEALIRSALDFKFGIYVWGTPRWEYNSISWYHSQLRLIVYDAFRTAT